MIVYRFILVSLFLMLAASPALAASTAAVVQEAQKIQEAGKLFDSVMRTCWNMQPKATMEDKDAEVLNVLAYMSDLGGSWTYHVRFTAGLANEAFLSARNEADVGQMRCLYGISVIRAEKYFNLVLSYFPENRVADKQEVTELMKSIREAANGGLRVVKTLQGMGVNSEVKIPDSAVLAKSEAIQKRIDKLFDQSKAMLDAEKDVVARYYATDLWLHSFYFSQENYLVSEAIVYGLVFPKAVRDQDRAGKARDGLVNYVTHIQRDMDKIRPKLKSYAAKAAAPRYKKAVDEMLQLDTTFQSFILDVMRVVSTGQDEPGEVQAKNGQPARQPAAPQDKPAGKERGKAASSGERMKWDPGALPR